MQKKKKTPPINFIINLQVYPFDLMISISQSDEQLGRSLDPYGDLPMKEIESCRYPSERCRGRYVMFSTGASLIRLRHLPSTPDDYGILQHEICHVVASVLDSVGMKLKILTSDEAYAYLTQFITKKVYEGMNKYY